MSIFCGTEPLPACLHPLDRHLRRGGGVDGGGSDWRRRGNGNHFVLLKQQLREPNDGWRDRRMALQIPIERATRYPQETSHLLMDVFDIQEKLSRTIVDALKLKLSPEENRRIAERPIDDVRAYECYLRARLETWRWTKEALDHALRLIQNGMDIVGDNELLYAAQGFVYIQYRQAGIDTSDANLRKAEECVEKLFARNSNSHHGHRLSGHLYRIRGQVQAGVQRLKRALAADPNNVDTLIELSYAYIISGKGFAARPLVAKAMEVDPLIPLTQCMPGFADALLDGHFDTAIEPYQRFYAMDPDNPMALLFYTWVLASNGMTEEISKVMDASSSTAKRTLPGHMALVLHFASGSHK